MSVSDSLQTYLLSTIDGFGFERLVQLLLFERDGDQFVALGGVKDGGADGYLRSVLETRGKATSFVQMSIQEDARGKIRGTVERLREFGRDVQTLTYWTSKKLSVDVLEDSLSNELDLSVRIRDWDAVTRLINHNDKTQKIFLDNFKPQLHELTEAKHSNPNFDVVSDPSVFVFLQFEKTERFGKGGLVSPIVDSLIYWALRDTDPDTKKLLSRTELKKKIAELLPSASRNLLPNVDGRLQALISKTGGGQQRVRYYQNSDSFCLPYPVRLEIASASALELTLKSRVLQSMADRARRHGATEPEAVAAVCERAIYRHFNEQGLILAAFLEKRLDGVNISDQIVEAELQETAASGTRLNKASYTAALKVLQEVFYTPSTDENDFLRKLSRTSLLLFSLKHSPRLIEYFNQLTGKFRLIVGTDIIVKALSETFLPREHRHVTNLLKVAKACGATLCLVKPVVNEVFTHIHATHHEFKNHYAEQEPYITPQLASQSDRILIRTYFYARLLLEQVAGWKSFIEMFLDYEELVRKSEKGQLQLEAYLSKVFELDLLDLEDGGVNVPESELQALAEKLEEGGLKNSMLARNDALVALAVYILRRKGGEVAKYDGFGLRTWWLTKESQILAHTGALVQKSGGVPYIMRPEFLLNFLSLSPSASAVDPVVRQLLPSHVGLQIGQHLPDGHMHKLLGHIDQWKLLPPARREVKVTEAVDQLKYDRLKRYESNLDLAGGDEADALVAALNAGK